MWHSLITLLFDRPSFLKVSTKYEPHATTLSLDAFIHSFFM